jgi:hypothetical protein
MSVFWGPGRANAIFVPSGDHDGDRPLAKRVSAPPELEDVT